MLFVLVWRVSTANTGANHKSQILWAIQMPHLRPLMQEIHVDSRMVFTVLSPKLRLRQFWIQIRFWPWILWIRMGGLTGSLITRSSCHSSLSLSPLHSKQVYRSAHAPPAYIMAWMWVKNMSSRLWRLQFGHFPLADIISSSCFSTSEVHGGPSALRAKNSNQSLFLQSDWIRGESWSWQEEEL